MLLTTTKIDSLSTPHFLGSKLIPQWVTFVMLLIFGTTSVAQDSAEIKLRTVKQALVDLALGAEVQVDSMAYMDNTGKLHESSVLSSSAGIRGIRVMSYLEEAKRGSKATIKATVMPDRSCREAKINLRRQVLVNIVDSDHLHGQANQVGDHSLLEVARFLEKQLINRLSLSKDWSASSKVSYASSYDQYLSGTSVDGVPYRLDIKINHAESTGMSDIGYSHWVRRSVARSAKFLQSTAVQVSGGSETASWPAADITYEFVLVDRTTNLSLWKTHGNLHYPAIDRGYSKGKIPLPLEADTSTIAADFVQGLTNSLACKPHQFQIMDGHLDKNTLVINAGRVAGITVGDQFLISTHPDLLKQALTDEGLSSLTLAKVESVNTHSAVLQQVAGPQWNRKSDLATLVATYF
ncbi:MAG: hypothetical protein P8O06_00095 [Porticoccaceae bacterium]|nr:hypothetical protein [Porticoccaceae bacterium]